ncbi:DpnD/PcfM family protein [Anaerovibrio sp. RM50]|uniref:DpnD/PcfM family protein n=1 Tax=Anaerovibrio sp. RM50 TaxID=1200557 RepID=UPI0009FE0C51|nr:DpnD/PcfM family protein [Anaerovibrio sp. RM50]
MSEFKVKITEVLSRTINVVASSEDEAKNIIDEMYKHEHIILGSDDFVGVEFDVVK